MEKYKFTLLSTEEYAEYKDIIPIITDYWWLRSPENMFEYSCYVNLAGEITYASCEKRPCCCLRPALLITNPSIIYSRGTIITRGKEKWIVLRSNTQECYVLCTEVVSCLQLDEKDKNFEQYLNTTLPNFIFSDLEETGKQFDPLSSDEVANYLASCSEEDFFEVFELFAKKSGKDIGELDDFTSWLNSTLKEIHLSWLEKESLSEENPK